MAPFSELLSDFVYDLYLAFITFYCSLWSSENCSPLSPSLKTVIGSCTLTCSFQYLVPEWSTNLNGRFFVSSLRLKDGEWGKESMQNVFGCSLWADRSEPIEQQKIAYNQVLAGMSEGQLSLGWKEQHIRL